MRDRLALVPHDERGEKTLIRLAVSPYWTVAFPPSQTQARELILVSTSLRFHTPPLTSLSNEMKSVVDVQSLEEGFRDDEISI